MAQFTDRYLKLPIRLYDYEQEKMGKDVDECDQKDVFVYINPFEIGSFCPHFTTAQGFDNGEPECTMVELKSGKEFQCYITVPKLIELLNNHQK